MKILFAADGSTYTQRALDYLATHDWIYAGNSLSVFTVVTPVPHRAAAMAGPALTQLYYEDDAEQVLRPIRERLAATLPDPDCSYVVARSVEAIVKKAESGQYDLIVMGSHGHSALASVVMGSVTTRVLAGCKVPVLLIR